MFLGDEVLKKVCKLIRDIDIEHICLALGSSLDEVEDALKQADKQKRMQVLQEHVWKYVSINGRGLQSALKLKEIVVENGLTRAATVLQEGKEQLYRFSLPILFMQFPICSILFRQICVCIEIS